MIPVKNNINESGTTSNSGGSSGGGGGNASGTDGCETNSNGIGMPKCSIEAEFNRIPDTTGWHRVYQDIRDKCDREASEKNFMTSESEKPQNRCLNRYRDVNPYDHSRIILHRGSVDYINANLVKLERADRKYILTQGPLSETVGHFWLMVWEHNSKAIIMLNKLMEKKQVKCHKYWPDKMGAEHALKLDEVKLTVELLRCEEYKNFCRRWFKLKDLESGQSREIIQFNYTTWPDFGIPSSPVAFLQFLKQVRDSNALDHNVGPAVVHCSAGIGRSGTFCLVDCCLVLIDKEGESNVSVKDVLYELRRYRMGLIQTADQLYFSYQAIIEGINLLKDPNFLDYNEQPSIYNDEQNHDNDSFNMDETPPPLPPRTLSLPPLTPSLPPRPLSSSPDDDAIGGADAVAGIIDPIDGNNTPGKPLPKIPNSESLSDDLYKIDNKYQDNDYQYDKDELNNFLNEDYLMRDCMSNRPLPPLPTFCRPQPRTVIVLNDSDSEENEFYEDDDDNDDNGDNNENDNDNDNDNANNDNVNVNINTNDQDANNDNVKIRNPDIGGDANGINNENAFDANKLNANQQNQNQNQKHKQKQKHIGEGVGVGVGVMPSSVSASTKFIQKNFDKLNGNGELITQISKEEQEKLMQIINGGEFNEINKQKSNGIDVSKSGAMPPTMNSENELKRRKRLDRQASLEQKVNEIKRKHREAEDCKKAKKQRSFVTYVAAGFIVGVICMYAYTKLASG